MYKIRNTTRGKLILFDLGVKLTAGEEIDLDSRCPRSASEASKHLRVAEHNGLITVVEKSVDQQTQQVVVIQQSAIDAHMISEMEKRIRSEIASSQSPKENTDVTQLAGKIDELITALKNGQVSSGSSSYSEELLLDADKLLEVHAKAMKNITSGSVGHVKAKETINTSDVSSNANELGDLLK